jgi:hypothetical protein
MPVAVTMPLATIPGTPAARQVLALTTKPGPAEMLLEVMLELAAVTARHAECKCPFRASLGVISNHLPSCNQEGHFARECPDKPAGGGLTGECFNCGEVGHNKADCTNPRVERPFTGTCNLCSEEGHSARNCPKQSCKLCKKEGHKAAECKNRRAPDWTGIPELSSEDAWKLAVDAAKVKDIDAFRVALKAYARALDDKFDLPLVETTLREDNLPIYLIGLKRETAINHTIVDLIGNPGREYVFSIQDRAKPRRKKMASAWPETPEENMKRLASCGTVQDCGLPLCSNCGRKLLRIVTRRLR